ncbi:MAG: two-component sensor histidine kinase [Hirschia sp.]|nr:two-component sensor histidine kinase [Hirschia sp.]MBF19311.1 two-component sensor histidine kinase [Hirschia sp.]
MNFNRLPAYFRTTTFKLALIHAALFILFSAGLLLFLFVQTAGRLERAAQDELLTELDAAIESHTKGGFDGLNAAIIQRPSSSPFYYLLTDPEGAKVSGDFNTLPAAPPEQGQADITFTYEARTFQGEPLRKTARGRLVRFQDGSVLMIAHDKGIREEIVTLVTNTVVQAGFLGLALSLIGGVIVSLSATRRVEALAKTMREVMEGDLTKRAPIFGQGDEFDRLAKRINAMLERLYRLMSASRHAGDAIAHDLRSPLSRLRNRLEDTLRRADNETDWRDAIGQSIEEVDRVLDTCSAILRLSNVEGGRMGKMEKVSVSQVLEDLAELYDPSCEAEDLGFEADIKQNLVINADRSLIIQAVANLLDNAVKYTPSGGKVALGARKKSGEVEIYVADNGPGVPAEDRHKVLERFYRMESARTEPGSGLGLALVAAVADMHQGRLELTDGTPNDTGVGLRVSLIFRAA